MISNADIYAADVDGAPFGGVPRFAPPRYGAEPRGAVPVAFTDLLDYPDGAVAAQSANVWRVERHPIVGSAVVVDTSFAGGRFALCSTSNDDRLCFHDTRTPISLARGYSLEFRLQVNHTPIGALNANGNVGIQIECGSYNDGTRHGFGLIYVPDNVGIPVDRKFRLTQRGAGNELVRSPSLNAFIGNGSDHKIKLVVAPLTSFAATRLVTMKIDGVAAWSFTLPGSDSDPNRTTPGLYLLKAGALDNFVDNVKVYGFAP